MSALLLTANRRFAFSASRRLARADLAPAENERVYGAGGERQWGSGENYEASFVFAGEPDPATGMLVNLAAVKQAVASVIDGRYDHAHLNLDTPPFDELPPTPENLTVRLLAEAREACGELPVQPVACRLAESEATGAIAYLGGAVEREYTVEFSAARRTCSPHLSDEENAALFGAAASPAGHGHGYRLRAVLRGPVDSGTGVIVSHREVSAELAGLLAAFDHKHLNLEVAELAGQAITTESLARHIHRRLSAALPVARVRLHENSWLFAEYDGARCALGVVRSFSAAHCLRSPAFSEEENRRVFGKCSNPNGHGHRYGVEATVAGALDERTGVVVPLDRLGAAIAAAVGPWENRHLDWETDEFRGVLSTGENIVRALWPRLDEPLGGILSRVRLAETENNRFALRRVEGS